VTTGFTGRGSMISVSCTPCGTVFNIRSKRLAQIEKKRSFDWANLQAKDELEILSGNDRNTNAFMVIF
jgi:hypothetical protein